MFKPHKQTHIWVYDRTCIARARAGRRGPHLGFERRAGNAEERAECERAKGEVVRGLDDVDDGDRADESGRTAGGLERAHWAAWRHHEGQCRRDEKRHHEFVKSRAATPPLLLPVVAWPLQSSRLHAPVSAPRYCNCNSSHPHSIHPQHKRMSKVCGAVHLPRSVRHTAWRTHEAKPDRPCSPVTHSPPPSCPPQCPPRISILTDRTVSSGTRCLGSCLLSATCLHWQLPQSATIAAIRALRAARGGGGGAVAARS